jgi:hypothetical protein
MIRTNSSQTIEQAQTAGSSARATEGYRSYRASYSEIGQRHIAEVDVLEQLRANMAQLEDLHGRMKFMMAEVSYLLKKS